MSSGSEFQAPRQAAAESPGHPESYEEVEREVGREGIPPGWHRPLPERLPSPGYWPAIMALGITFMMWGLAVGFNEVLSTIVILSFIGFVLFVAALIGWIGDLRDERKDQNE